MLRRTAFLALSSLVLSGCVTYEVVERRVYREDGSYTRSYDPYDDGRRYEERSDETYDRYGEARRYEYDSPRYGSRYDDPYDRWFYGYRGYGSAWALDPYFGGSRGTTIVYGSRWHRPGWYVSSWYAPSWSSGWGWGPSWYGHSRPWGGGYYGYGYGYTPSRPHNPRPHNPRPPEARPMPKPFVRSVGPDLSLPVMTGPSVGGEALRPTPRERRWEEPGPRAAMPEATPRAKPQPTFVEADPRVEPVQRFERRPRVEEPRYQEPRFEAREPERVFERRVEAPREEPRFEPREEPRFEPREEPRFEPREEPRENPAVEEHVE